MEKARGKWSPVKQLQLQGPFAGRWLLAAAAFSSQKPL